MTKLPGLWKVRRCTSAPESVQHLLVLLLFLYTMASCIVHRDSPQTGIEIKKILTYFLLYIIGILLFSNDGRRRTIEYGLILLLSIAVLRETYIGIGQLTGRRLSGNNYFCCTGSFANPGPLGGFLATCGALILHMVMRRKYGWRALVPSLMCVIVMLPITMSRASWLAFLSSAAVLTATDRRVADRFKKHKADRSWKCIMTALLTITVIAASVGLYRMKQKSADSRLLMYRMSVHAILDSPLTGHGPGSFAKAYGDAQYEYFARGTFTERERLTADCPEYPFNTLLKVGVEYGIPAMLMLAAIIVMAIISSVRHDRAEGYGLLCLSVFAMFSYPQELPVFRMLTPLLIAGAACENTVTEVLRPGRRTIPVKCIILGTAVSGLAYIGLSARSHTEACRLWHKYEKHYNSGRYDKSAALYGELSDKLQSEHTFLFQYGRSLLESGRFEEADSVLRCGADLSCDPMFRNLIGRCRQATGRYVEAEECYRRAFLMVPNRIYPLVLSAKLSLEIGDTAGFSAKVHQIRSFRPKIENSLTHQLRDEIEELAARTPAYDIME